jgi:hypothetical protein
VKKWGPAWLVAFFASVLVLISHEPAPSLFDTDTKVLLTVLRERNNPWSWFTGDWPLQNHFYRPISTLFFEFDQRVYGTNSAGYGWTNALLIAVGVLLLFWLLREIFDRPWPAAAGAMLFATWCIDRGDRIADLVGLAFLPVLAIGIWQHRRNVRAYLAAPLMIGFLSLELRGKAYLYTIVMQWLPGRTATVMAVFATIALAAYARYIRLSSAERKPVASTPLTPPATRSSEANVAPRRVYGWLLVSAIATLLALGSYEQAIMLPIVALGVALSFYWRNRTVDFRWIGMFIVLVVAYMAYRYQVVPTVASKYQKQQFRFGPGVYISMMNYLSPFLGGITSVFTTFTSGPEIFLGLQPYVAIIEFGQEVATYYQARRAWALPLVGYLISAAAFAPMSFLKTFNHYHYWPMMLRTIFVIGLLLVVAEVVVSACSRPVRQAPPRPNPAPGSLPRP